jgi:nucleoporin NUP159
MLLKAKLVSTGGKTGGKLAAPTVEAVMNTILKMTNMVEKRSGDIDLLENQMRKLGLDTVSNNSSIGDGHNVREVSTVLPPSTPGRPSSSTYGLFFTPESSIHGTPRSLGTPVGSLAAGSPGSKGTPRRKLNAITPEEVKIAKERIARQRVVTKRLRDALVAASPKVRAIGE